MPHQILETLTLGKRYERFTAVDNVSFSVREGEFLTLLGPSGSGKTTTLHMISGLILPTSGSILLDGLPLDPLPPYKRNIGMVFQNYALFPHMTVFKNVAFPLEARRMKSDEIRRRVNDVLEVVGLPDVCNRYPAQLSGGQQQRVALARAMVFQPRLLLMDEPLGALDKKLREQIQIELVRLHRQNGISIVYVTHDQEEALVMSDRVAVFNKGKIEQLSTPQDIYENPGSLFIADFIGESNCLAVSVVGREGGDFIVDGASRMRGRAQCALSDGEKAVLVVRPERIRVTTPGTVPISANTMSGRIKSMIYLGKSRKYVVMNDAGQELVALEQCIEGQNMPELSEGSEVVAFWSNRESIVLADAR